MVGAGFGCGRWGFSGFWFAFGGFDGGVFSLSVCGGFEFSFGGGLVAGEGGEGGGLGFERWGLELLDQREEKVWVMQ